MKKILDTQKYVLEVLKNNVNSRFSDNILYLEVIYKIRPELKYLDFKNVFLNYKLLKVPSFKTVERARRKLEKLRLYVPPKNIKKEREKMIIEYINYAFKEV